MTNKCVEFSYTMGKSYKKIINVFIKKNVYHCDIDFFACQGVSF